MATRAMYVFKDDYDTFTVYKHWDGYPSMAVKFIENALSKAWELPRFESCDFGAAFIAANKNEAGDIRLSHGNDEGCDYKYEISFKDGSLSIICYNNKDLTENWLPTFEGTIDKFKEWINNNEQH